MVDRIAGGDAGARLHLLMNYDLDDYAAPAVNDLVKMRAAAPEDYEVELATDTADLFPLGKVVEVIKEGVAGQGAVGELEVEILRFTQLVEFVEDGNVDIGVAVECQGSNKVTTNADGTDNICVALAASDTAARGADGGLAMVLC